VNIQALMQDKVFRVHLDDFLSQAKGKKKHGDKFNVYLELLIARAMEINGRPVSIERSEPMQDEEDDIPMPAPFPDPLDAEKEWERIMSEIAKGVDKIKMAHATAGTMHATAPLSIALPGYLNPAEFALRAIQAGLDVPAPNVNGGPSGWSLGWGDNEQEISLT